MSGSKATDWERVARVQNAKLVALVDGSPAASKRLTELLAHYNEADLKLAWAEVARAWEVCASMHKAYCKRTDPMFTTRQADFVRHAEEARAKLKP